MKSEQLNSYTEIKQRTDRDVRQMGVLVSETYEADSTDGQTIINLSFSIDATNSTIKKQVWVFVDGQKLVEGSSSNYTFTNITNGLSSQITLTSPLIAGLPIQVYKLGAYQETLPNPSSVTATLLNDVAQPHKMAQAAFKPFIQKTLITAPNTQIINRAQVEAGSLKAIAGVERIPCRSISILASEFGSNGEPVYELDTKDSRVRFVGSGWNSISNVDGTRPATSTVGNYLEVIFYGTDLNILTWAGASPGTVLVTIDGGSEGVSNILPSAANILNSRNYNTNQVLNVASGLSLGWHNVKLRLSVAGSGLNVYGLEILNTRSDLAVLSGSAFNGMKQETLSSLSSSAFNLGVSGTRGARIVKYLLSGAISQVVQEVNSSSGFLTAADHTNEEIARKINGREFGANRSDDFSTLAGVDSARAFTLNDGTTTLILSSGKYNNDYSGDNIHTAASGFLTIVFTGTGLDLICRGDSLLKTYSVTIDGTSVGSISFQSPTNTADSVFKICSGLPYGTHTVKLTNTAGIRGFGISDFIVYQPKKPTIPSGAIEICDYNVMPSYSAATSGQSFYISRGVVSKMATREAIYSGTWSVTGVNSAFESGVDIRTVTASSYIEYTFWGSGIEWRTILNTGTAVNETITIDGSSNLSGFTTSTQNSGGVTFTAATGAIAGTPTVNGDSATFSITGLSLGLHKIRITQNGTANMYAGSFNVVTPIHINSSSFKIGSLSLKDARIFSPIIDKPEKIDLSKAKAWVNYGTISERTWASENIQAVLKVAAGQAIIYFAKPFKNDSYAVIGGVTGSWHTAISEKRPGWIKITTADATHSQQDNDLTSLAFFGELEDEGEI